MRKLIDLDMAIDAVEKESQVDGAYGYMDTKSIIDLLNDLPSEQSDKYLKEEYKKIILFLLDAFEDEHMGMKDFYIQEIQNKWKINFN